MDGLAYTSGTIPVLGLDHPQWCRTGIELLGRRSVYGDGLAPMLIFAVRMLLHRRKYPSLNLGHMNRDCAYLSSNYP